MRVVVFGGGYAGIVAVKRLERRLPDTATVMLVDQRPYHLVRHELHRVIRQPDVSDALRIPFEEILGRAEFRQQTVSDIDPDGGTAIFENGDSLEFDAGIVAFGAEPAYYGLDGVEAYGTPLDSIGTARKISKSMTSLLEQGEGTAVVAGAGLAGVQAAGELAELRADAGATDVSIVLLEQADSVVPTADDRFTETIAEQLQDKGVDLRTENTVAGATAETIELESGGSLPYSVFVWTGGISGAGPIRGDRPTVRADLRLGDRMFGAGDAVRVIDGNGELVTASAQSAVGMAPVAVDNAILRAEKGDGAGFRPRYHNYHDSSSARTVTVGNGAVAKIGPGILTGPAARTLKSVIGSRYLSTAGAIEAGVSLVRMEFGLAHPRAGEALEEH
ncbi:NAD(P)/FAD-dependent oxidoreductase [Halodesulfurarchaeum sp.]|uniref:NAD(P)/FAD-dependent oxidoreductase n=1 Tax=Halodesulfurarchaeum sp. TaxID=1980530 RepID=UPI002FC32968